jgi:HAD superfamily hydrolase (TIGR01509 family)
MPHSVELVIFDCDGVLLDSERLAIKVDVLVLRQLGWPLSEADVIDRFIGRSDEFMQSALEEHLGRKLPANWAAPFEPLYRQAFESELAPVDGVIDALDRITIPTCVASSSSHDKLRYTLELVGLYKRFEGRIFSASDVPNGKPAPDLFLHAAEQMGAPPAKCVAVEDSRYGVQAARDARVLAFAGGLTRAELLKGPNTVVFREMRELPRLLEDHA